MRFRIRTFRRRRRRRTKRGRGIPYIKNNNFYFGRGSQRGSGVISRLLAKALAGAGDLIGL